MRISLLAVGIACLSSAFLPGCGSSSSSSNAISGTVAVGIPLTNATLRVVDATGAAVATGVVVAANGKYPAVTLTGTPPYRLEACGTHGASDTCLYSVANGPGRANVTPLTNAVVLLAIGALPGAVMAGAVMNGVVTGLDPASVHEAQASLQLALTSILSSAGVAPDFNFITGNLVAGSGRGYDFVLDSLNVTTGAGAEPFVQITPRLGTGNVYLEPGSPPVGELIAPPAASHLFLAGIPTLFQNLTAALASAETCSDPVTGIRAQIADDARMNTGGATRTNDDAWLALPAGAEWDNLIRNFYMGGRTVTVTLFSDEGCSTLLPVEGQSVFIVDVPGLLPLWEAMSTLPWPALTPTALTELGNLAIAPFTNGSYTAAWSFPQGHSAIEQGTFCINGDCTAGAGNWLGQAQAVAGATSLTIPLSVGDVPVDSSTFKLLALSGRTPDGLSIQSNEMYCPLAEVGSGC